MSGEENRNLLIKTKINGTTAAWRIGIKRTRRKRFVSYIQEDWMQPGEASWREWQLS